MELRRQPADSAGWALSSKNQLPIHRTRMFGQRCIQNLSASTNTQKLRPQRPNDCLELDKRTDNRVGMPGDREIDEQTQQHDRGDVTPFFHFLFCLVPNED